jgi:guanylate kinase
MVKKAPPEFQPLTKSNLTILVGLTGVGKTTVLKLLQQRERDFTLLPNRREITDAIIIPTLQREAGETVQPVNDRVQRFQYTARYRAKYPGGMAYALSQLAVAPEKTSVPLIFDGLRGLNEVQHAVTYFPAARFVVLDAPDMVRLNRLLKRDDSFDKTKIQTSLLGKNILAALMGIPDIEAVFNEEELQQIARAARMADIPIDSVVQTARIIVEERRNYDSRAARVHLVRSLSTDQVLVIDTADQTVEAVAQQMADWL